MTKDLLTELLCIAAGLSLEERARLLAVAQGMELARAMRAGQNG